MDNEMKEKVAYIFAALEKAEVSILDFSRVTTISRETFYRWKNGGAAKDQIRLNMAYTVALRLEKACRAGKLPLVDKLKKEQRYIRIRSIVREMSAK